MTEINNEDVDELAIEIKEPDWAKILGSGSLETVYVLRGVKSYHTAPKDGTYTDCGNKIKPEQVMDARPRLRRICEGCSSSFSLAARQLKREKNYFAANLSAVEQLLDGLTESDFVARMTLESLRDEWKAKLNGESTGTQPQQAKKPKMRDLYYPEDDSNLPPEELITKNWRAGSRTIDLTGQKFGKLTVLEHLGNLGTGRAVWKCQCECGKTCNVRSTHLRGGTTQSCGCGRGRPKS